MTGENFIKHPAKAKIVTAIENVPIGEAELGEMVFETTNNRLYIRILSGWKFISTDG